MRQLFSILLTISAATPASVQAQDAMVAPESPVPAEPAQPQPAAPVAPPPAIVFAPGTGNGSATPSSMSLTPPPPVRTLFACAGLEDAKARLLALYADAAPIKGRLDKGLLETALESYRQNHCIRSQSGPSTFAVVDFAKRSSEPRLWYVDLAKVEGIDAPVLVTHGNGSDPDNDGYVDRLSNINDSRMSSIGAFRGAERYQGRNGLSLRLDGLEPGNNLVRYRNIVVHTTRETDRSYFGYVTRERLNGAIGVSDGCFVVERPERERLIRALENGGFLYAGVGTLDPGRKMPETVLVWPTPIQPPVTQPTVVGEIVFTPGTGTSPNATATGASLP